MYPIAAVLLLATGLVLLLLPHMVVGRSPRKTAQAAARGVGVLFLLLGLAALYALLSGKVGLPLW